MKKRINSCTKGKTGERQAAHHLIALGFEGARRTEQHQGAGSIGDVMAPTLPHLSIEVKVGRQCGFGAWLAETMAKAEADCRHLFPVILWRGQGERTWLLTFKEDDILWTLSRGEDQAVTLRRLDSMHATDTMVKGLGWKGGAVLDGHNPLDYSTDTAHPVVSQLTWKPPAP